MTAPKAPSEQLLREFERWAEESIGAIARATPTRLCTQPTAAPTEVIAFGGMDGLRVQDTADMPERWTARRGRGKARRSLSLIEAAATVLAEIQPASVRAVCYRLFTLGLIDSMNKAETNRVSEQLKWAREQGVIAWDAIVDETREPERVSAWQDPAAFVRTVKNAYRRDRWADQPEWLEVWAEKGTVRGTIAPVLEDFGITFRVMHGYGSTTAVHQIAEETRRANRRLTAFYVGDWDPSGLHMSAIDLPCRLARYGGHVNIIRLALEAEDLAGLPSFPADTKQRDSRYRWFTARYGEACWELEALSPVALRDRLARAIRDRIDGEAWNRAEVAERAECESLNTILHAWPSVAAASIFGPASK
jgi:hypothetical protein